jgi:hypothetical protein
VRRTNDFVRRKKKGSSGVVVPSFVIPEIDAMKNKKSNLESTRENKQHTLKI